MRVLCAILAVSLAATAADDEKKARIKGIRQIAEQGTGGIPRIAPYLEDRDEEVRWEAVKAISEIGTRHAIDPLITATRDSQPDIQIRATDGLVNFYLPGYLKTGWGATIRKATTSLKGRFTDTNTDIVDPYVTARPDVIEALGKLARGGASME